MQAGLTTRRLTFREVFVCTCTLLIEKVTIAFRGARTRAADTDVQMAARRGALVEGAWIYTTASPCWACFRVLVNAGIQRFVYGEPYRQGESRPRIEEVAETLGLEVRALEPPGS